MELIEKVVVLERDLRGLIRKWERYFAGDLKVPPVNDRESFYRRLRMVVDEPGQLRASDRFRLDQLQARYGTYSSNWERMLREREEGVRRWVPPSARAAAASEPSPPAEPTGSTVAAEAMDPPGPTEPRETLRADETPGTPQPTQPRDADPNEAAACPVDPSGTEDLFSRWSAAKTNLGQEVRLDRSAFDAQIQAQRQAAEAKLGSAVRFDVAIVDGKVKLTARRAASSDNEG
jgi:hypothetical protein